MKNELIRRKVLNFLQWNDKNGYYTDERCDLEEVPRMTYEDSIKYLFGVFNEELYYNIADNMFELDFNEVIEYAKEKGVYQSTYERINKLICSIETIELYRNLIS
ncbi:hypothetical protein [Clostridium perfringens]|uniref:hypothetical protein n=1 Tax=Clostridium perfringens TaxID=1502 RepID=UPI0007769EB2|nr:hypothetical protein [Clostridium perfringens]AMN30856.1 hypothetical protein JFP55_pH0068 [Clostridium perfringens]MDM0935734.1 hypothetical protein [Clostridium perfringens]PWX46956.1 hypothetical protein CYK61_14075 [Clostridium perfringens]HAT4117249.1 hypothetical protein [Clostridium perfringens]HAT4216025.1 hypothetical protein [Clostridium perfringens]